MAKISVIVPVYNVEPYICQCIDSILNQTITDFELILIDDGSRDNCPLICDDYAKKDNRIVVIHKENGGLSSARNAGLDYVLKNSDSEFISFVDSDDFIHCQFLESLLNGIKDSDVCLCNFSEFDDKSRTINKRTTLHFHDQFFDKISYWNLGIYNPATVVAWNKLYKKELFEDVRYPVGKTHEDEFVIHKIIDKCSNIHYLSEELYVYRKRVGSIIKSENINLRDLVLLEFFTDRLIFYKTISKSDDLFNLNYKYTLKLLINMFKTNKNNKTYKRCFRNIKALLRDKRKTKSEMLFFLFPSIYFLLKRK